jgi:hypothetical protein
MRGEEVNKFLRTQASISNMGKYLFNRIEQFRHEQVGRCLHRIWVPGMREDGPPWQLPMLTAAANWILERDT